jgi:hypothetical protein
VVCLTSAEQEYQAFQAEDGRAPGQSLAASVEVLVAEDNAVLQIQQLFQFIHAANWFPWSVDTVQRPVTLNASRYFGISGSFGLAFCSRLRFLLASAQSPAASAAETAVPNCLAAA